MSRRPLAIVIRLSALGDVLLAGPAIQRIALDHDVLLVTDPPYAALAAALPGVSEVRALDHREGVAGVHRLGVELRASHPSRVFDLQAKVRTRLLAHTIGATIRTLGRRTAPEALGAILGHDRILQEEHQARRYLRVMEDEPAPPVRLGPLALHADWVSAADQIARAAGWQPEERAVAVAPSATHATKGWPVARYAELVRRIADLATPILIVAGPNDAAAVSTFRTALGPRPRVVDSSAVPLTTLAALLARSRILVGNDSGPIHLASALDVPTVAVFGPTSVRRWGPLPGTEARHRVARLDLACSPCSNHGDERCPLGHHDCLEKLDVDTVVHELEAVAA